MKPDYILGVDKGLQFCYEYDIRPDYIVGDFGQSSRRDSGILPAGGRSRSVPLQPVRMRQIQRSLDKALEEGQYRDLTGGNGDQDRSRGLQSARFISEAWEKKVSVWIVTAEIRSVFQKKHFL